MTYQFSTDSDEQLNRRQRFDEMSARELVDVKFLADRLLENTIVGVVARARAIECMDHCHREGGIILQEMPVGEVLTSAESRKLTPQAEQLIKFLTDFDRRSKAKVIVDEMEEETGFGIETNRSRLLGLFEFFEAEELDHLTDTVLTVKESADAADQRDRGMDPATNPGVDTPLGQAEGGKIKDVVEELPAASQFSDDPAGQVIGELRHTCVGTVHTCYRASPFRQLTDDEAQQVLAKSRKCGYR